MSVCSSKIIIVLFNINSRALPYIENSELGQILNTFYNDWECEPDVDGSLQSQHSFMFNYMIPTLEGVLTEIKHLLASQANYDYFDGVTYSDDTLNISEEWNWENFIHYYSMEGLHQSSAFNEAIANNPTQNFLFTRYQISEGYFSDNNCNE